MELSTTLHRNFTKYFSYSIKQIIFTDQPAPAGAEAQDMSVAQDGGVVGWMQGDTYFVSTQRPGVKVTAPADCGAMFSSLPAESIDVAMLDTSKVESINLMFYDCKSLVNLKGLETWDVSNVTKMFGTFSDCTSLASLDGLAGWDTSNVTDMSYMFDGCGSLENIDPLANWDTSQVEDMRRMFRDCKSLASLDGLSHWNTSNVTNMRCLFKGCESLKTLNGLAQWDVYQVNDETHMFSYCKSLSNIDALSSLFFRNNIEGLKMFSGCISLPSESVEKFRAHHAELTAEYVSKMKLSTILKNDHGNNFPASAKHITFTDTPAPAGVVTQDMSEAQDRGVVGWMQGDTYYVSTQRKGVKVTAPVNCSELFSVDWIDGCKFQTVDAAALDVSHVTNMSGMFWRCTSLKSISGLSQWDVSHVTDMDCMFSGCKFLETVDALAQWDTHNVADMFGMFSGCAALTSLDGLETWDISHVTDMNEMFSGCAALPSESVEKFRAHHAELTAEYRPPRPYIPKSPSADKIHNIEPER
jgi:surface protein